MSKRRRTRGWRKRRLAEDTLSALAREPRGDPMGELAEKVMRDIEQALALSLDAAIINGKPMPIVSTKNVT